MTVAAATPPSPPEDNTTPIALSARQTANIHKSLDRRFLQFTQRIEQRLDQLQEKHSTEITSNFDLPMDPIDAAIHHSPSVDSIRSVRMVRRTKPADKNDTHTASPLRSRSPVTSSRHTAQASSSPQQVSTRDQISEMLVMAGTG